MKPNMKKFEVKYSIITPDNEFPRTAFPTARNQEAAEAYVKREFYDPSGQSKLIIHSVKEVIQ